MSEATFAERLLAVQCSLDAPKSKHNDFGNYNYRSCEDILSAVKPLLKEQGLTLSLTDSIEQCGERYYVKATARVTDGTSYVETTALAREAESKKGMDSSQVTGTASSYARKYALNGLFLIDDERDDDTRKPTDEKPKQRVTRKPKPSMSPVEAAKQRLWAAVKDYAERNGKDPNLVIEAALTSPDNDGSVEFFDRVAEEFKSA